MSSEVTRSDLGFPGGRAVLGRIEGGGKPGVAGGLSAAGFQLWFAPGWFWWGVKSGRLWIILRGKPREPVDRLPVRCEKREGTKGNFKIVTLSSWENGVPAEALEGIQLSEAEPRAGGTEARKTGL